MADLGQFWPEVAKIYAHLGQLRPASGSAPNLAGSGPNLADVGLNAVELAQNSAAAGPNLAGRCVEIARLVRDFSRSPRLTTP